jgi:hypothetical protein
MLLALDILEAKRLMLLDFDEFISPMSKPTS